MSAGAAQPDRKYKSTAKHAAPFSLAGSSTSTVYPIAVPLIRQPTNDTPHTHKTKSAFGGSCCIHDFQGSSSHGVPSQLILSLIQLASMSASFSYETIMGTPVKPSLCFTVASRS